MKLPYTESGHWFTMVSITFLIGIKSLRSQVEVVHIIFYLINLNGYAMDWT